MDAMGDEATKRRAMEAATEAHLPPELPPVPRVEAERMAIQQFVEIWLTEDEVPLMKGVAERMNQEARTLGFAVRCSDVELRDRDGNLLHSQDGQVQKFDSKYICFTNKRTLILDASGIAAFGNKDQDADYSSKLMSDVKSDYYIKNGLAGTKDRYVNQSREDDARSVLGMGKDSASRSMLGIIRDAYYFQEIRYVETAATRPVEVSANLLPQPDAAAGAIAHVSDEPSSGTAGAAVVISEATESQFVLLPGDVVDLKFDSMHYTGAVAHFVADSSGARGQVKVSKPPERLPAIIRVPDPQRIERQRDPTPLGEKPPTACASFIWCGPPGCCCGPQQADLNALHERTRAAETRQKELEEKVTFNATQLEMLKGSYEPLYDKSQKLLVYAETAHDENGKLMQEVSRAHGRAPLRRES